MKSYALSATAVLFCFAAPHADARVLRITQIWSTLDRDGDLSAGWVQVLPVLASACNMRLDTSQLTDKIMDLSRANGNLSYTRALYSKLYELENKQARNQFVQAWTARFNGHQDDAGKTAATLWGDSGDQFPGVLKRDVADDGTAPASPSASAK